MKRLALSIAVSALASLGLWLWRTPAPEPVPTGERVAATTVDAVDAQKAGAAPVAQGSGRGPVDETAPLLLEDPAQMRALEQGFANLGALAFGAASATTEQLAATEGWRVIVGALDADLTELYRGDKAHGVGMRFTHRAFDPSWLASALTRFDLAAVVNRVDRKVFHPGTCGELRFVYRLAYDVQTKAGPFSSRLPMTVNVVFFLPGEGDDPGCKHAARALVQPQAAFPTARLKSVEVNLQSERWPSTTRPDLGGQADYILRVFAPNAAGKLEPDLLENTPDAGAIRSNPQLQKRFVQWLTDPATAKAADHGTALLPDEFLARRAVSATPRGLARTLNRPFSALAESLGDDVPAGVVTRETLRRLDQLSCAGCHQSRSVAGFHMLGSERDPARVVDALAIAHSPHVHEDMPRRRAYLEALFNARVPEEARPAAEHASNRGAFGDSCGLTLFKEWTCAAGLVCVAVDDDEVGACLPAEAAVGSACETGIVARPRGIATDAHRTAKGADPRADRILSAHETACGTGRVCENVSVGFPGGMCAGSCDDLGPDGKCGGIALLTPFNNCLARGELFSECAKHARPAALRACSDFAPCRNDYLCSKVSPTEGACLPPYFVLQMRVDGHPLTPLPRWRALIGR